MNNLLQPNSWEIKKFLCLVLVTQLAMLGLVGLAALGYDIPILRQIVGFIYLTFIPGLLILRILRLHRLSTAQTLLYSAGLSISLIMFTGLLMNTLYPVIGIPRPISLPSCLATLTIVVLVLSILAYKRDRDFSALTHFSIAGLLSPVALFLILLPILSALGAQIVNFYHSNLLLLAVIALIALVVVLVAFGRFIPRGLYPLAVVSIALALLWHRSLISLDLTGSDIQVEYYFQNLVLTNASWDSTVSHSINAMLSIVMLGPIYSLLMNMDGTWLLKIIYPLLFSLVPLALFEIFRKQTDDKVAFLAAFFFMSVSPFFTDMLQLARQQIAELFFALTLLLMVNKEMTASKRSLLLVVFGFSMVTSHYGLSYIYMIYLFLAIPLIYLIRSKWLSNPAWAGRSPSTISANYMALFVVFCLAWYMYLSSSFIFIAIVDIGNHIYNSLSEFLLLQAREPSILLALGLASPMTDSVERQVFKYIQYATQIFIVVGVIQLLVKRRTTRFHPEYIAMTLASGALLLMGILVPHFSRFLHMTRIYHITLFTLAPFCILGGKAVFQWLLKLVCRRRSINHSIPLNLAVLLVLVPYFLFFTQFVFTLSGDLSTSIALSPGMVDAPVFSKSESHAREWLLDMSPDNSTVYSDVLAGVMLAKRFEQWRVRSVPLDIKRINPDSYIFLRKWNITRGEMHLYKRVGAHWVDEYIKLREDPTSSFIYSRNKIYDSGGAQVLWSR